MKKTRLILFAFMFIVQGIMPVASSAEMQEGEASYIADRLDGNTTASGEPYDKNAFSAAHPTLPFGTTVIVTYLETGQSVEVVINDRGPNVKGRIIDLSSAAARKIGLLEAGHGRVTLEVVNP